MARGKTDPALLRRLRDEVIRYIYEHGASSGFNSSEQEIVAAAPMTRDEFEDVTRLIYTQGLLGNSFTVIGDMGLSDEGQREAERLGPRVRMREPDTPNSVTIHANYSLVQVAGANSRQVASLMVDTSAVELLLERIAEEIPRLGIPAAKQEEASGLLKSFREAIANKLSDAGIRAIGAALGSILVSAGNDLGRQLMDQLNISAG
jgi:hypothetical protein